MVEGGVKQRTERAGGHTGEKRAKTGGLLGTHAGAGSPADRHPE